MAKKKKPAKKSKALSADLRAVRASIGRLVGTGDSTRAARVSERAASRAKGRLPAIPVVMPKNDPRHPQHFTVCVYVGIPGATDLPVDVVKWKDAVVKYAMSPRAAKPIQIALLLGHSAEYVSSVAGHCTFFPVLERGRAVDDIARAVALAAKARGALN